MDRLYSKCQIDYPGNYNICKSLYALVTEAVLRLYPIIVVQPKPVLESNNDWRWKWFKGCLGALDGTYVPVRVPSNLHPKYRNRKGSVCVNVLGVCDVDMQFSYILVGWEGSAADSRVLRDAVRRQRGLRVPSGNYYLCDGGYTNGPGFLAPFRGVRYHLHEFGEGPRAPRNPRELFNLRHARARNMIERAFGVLKMRWAVLRSKTFFDIVTQNRVILACCLLQNFIRSTMNNDPMEGDDVVFEMESNMEEPIPPPNDYVEVVEPTNEWTTWRETLAISMFNEWLMDSTTSMGRGPNVNNPRRSWTIEEERALIQGLKELVARGMKADNGLRSGYTLFLEQYMRQQFPGTTIRAEPHITSKITVWKKNYGLLQPLLQETSGVGWSESGHILEVEEPVWQDYVKVYPKGKGLRNKPWPFYSDWVDIFGKDRATGEGAEGFADAVQEVLSNTGDNAPAQNVSSGGGGGDFESNENEIQSSPTHGVESSASGRGKRVGKRKRLKDAEVEVVGLLHTLCEKADKRWGEMVERIGVQHDAKEQRKVLYEALKCIPILTTEQRFIVSKYFCRNKEDMDVFFSVDDEEKASMGVLYYTGQLHFQQISSSSQLTPRHHPLNSNPMERHASMLRIAERYRRPGWSANEERECYRLFFNLCRETPDVNVPAVFNSLWAQLSIQLTEEMLHYFSVLMVKSKIRALHRNFRDFLRFLETPGVEVHAESGLVNVNHTYWAYVGRETDMEYYFRHVGFQWYEECVDLWDLRRAAGVHIGAGERAYDPIMFDDTDEENIAADDPNGANGDDDAALDVGNEHGHGAAGNMKEVEDDAVEEVYEDEYAAEAAAVEVVQIEEDHAPDEMDIDTDVDSCVDSD
ncbi:Unknown protein [Striga hermonthica]|uniref:DDE Tnp4 domain-containing protein n=1 Tax=Striga hermonthica TaxID=68872 RepID=A0A9N7NFZ7_STRHE|nr:Unknown protein [Striga hermonthica]